MDFFGYPTRRLENKFLQIDFLTEAGPRLVRLSLTGSQENLLAEEPNMTQATPFGEYRFYGGHRLWHSPEIMPRSYLPDNEGLKVEDLADGGVLLTQPVETATWLRKSMELHLSADAPSLTIHHSIKNEGLWPLECAPWAITQFKLGGQAIIPQQIGVPEAILQPDRRLTIWNYTRLADARLHLGDDFILVDGAAAKPACKIGTLNPQGWLAYLIGDVLFIKRFAHDPVQPHVDFGCDTEVYVCDRFIELETLGPLVVIQPGQTITHTEAWEVHTNCARYQHTLEGVRAMVKDLKL
jgi:hypothetical protein